MLIQAKQQKGRLSCRRPSGLICAVSHYMAKTGCVLGMQEQAGVRSQSSKGRYKNTKHYEDLSRYLDVAWEWIRRCPRVHLSSPPYSRHFAVGVLSRQRHLTLCPSSIPVL